MNPYIKNTYAATMVNNTATPVDLVILLYDGAIERLRKTVFHMNHGDVKRKLQCIHGAMNIIEELLASLNLEAGGKVAENLQALYVYMLKELADGNAKNDVSQIKRVENLLGELRSAWRQVQQPVQQGNP
jgi:flagellar protein FliS